MSLRAHSLSLWLHNQGHGSGSAVNVTSLMKNLISVSKLLALTTWSVVTALAVIGVRQGLVRDE
eukprot:2599995-Amphidinium_carterae.1